MAANVLIDNTAFARSGFRWAAVAFWACFAVGLGNDFLFNALRGSYEIYFADYALKALMLAVALSVAHRLPVAPRRSRHWLLLSGLLVLCVVSGILSAWLGAIFGEAWRLFEWPQIESPLLRTVDLTVGLALNATAEEFVYRRLALAALPLGSPGNLLVSSVLFALTHWGNGPGTILAALLCGVCWGLAYRSTGSLALVITAHYFVDATLFL